MRGKVPAFARWFSGMLMTISFTGGARVRIATTLLICCLMLAASGGVCSAPRTDSVAAREARVAAAQTRVDALRRSLPAATQPWVGEYYLGDHLGFNLDLVVTADRFAYTANSDIGPIGDGNGLVERVHGGIVLRLAADADHAAKRRLEDTLGITLVPVQWGPRRYLVPEREFPGFASAINHGMEPDSPGLFLLRAGDEKKPVEGLGGLPAGITHFVFAKQVYVDVVGFSRIPSPPQPAEIGPLLKNERYRLVFDKGMEDGLAPGLDLWLCHPYNEAAFVTVDRVEPHRAYGILKVDFELDPRPSTALRFTTGQYPPTPECDCGPHMTTVTRTR